MKEGPPRLGVMRLKGPELGSCDPDLEDRASSAMTDGALLFLLLLDLPFELSEEAAEDESSTWPADEAVLTSDPEKDWEVFLGLGCGFDGDCFLGGFLGGGFFFFSSFFFSSFFFLGFGLAF